MPFKPIKPSTVALESPEAMFRDLRKRTVAAPHAHQADILRSYQRDALEKPHVALQLPTGSGKTLVGLLISEWRRRTRGERCLYLCPTNQLVNQVVGQARAQYGIDAIAFTGSKAEYPSDDKAAYGRSDAIAVTSYSSLFNVAPYFLDPQFIVLDDAHAGEQYISSAWSLRVERFREQHAPLFATIVGILARVISPISLQRLTGSWNDHWDRAWVDKIPTPSLVPLFPELSAAIDEHVNGLTLRYQWRMLRDHLTACQLYVGSSDILLRPLIPPTLTHAPFANATQRLFMSATLGAGGDLERISGIPEIYRLAAPEGWDRQGVGRRLFLFPGSSLSSENEEEVQGQLIERAGRALVIVPDDRRAESYREWVSRKLRIPVFDARQIEQSREPFVSSRRAVAVMANRYDGLDLPKDDCRLLLVEGVPRATNLQEQFFVSKMGAVALLNDRILTRVVQAFGRCTRDATDYAAVVVWGDELLSYLSAKERRTFLHPEVQAELEFGLTQSKEAGASTYVEYLDHFLRQSKEWSEAENSIVALRNEAKVTTLPGTADLRNAVKSEVDYQYFLWNNRLPEALDAARKVLGALLSPDLRGYRALWLYLAGSAAWLAENSGQAETAAIAREYFRQASAAALGVQWLTSLAHSREFVNESAADQSPLFSVIERLESQLGKLGLATDQKFAREEAFIRQNLTKADSGSFEQAQERLGRLLGYEAGNLESTGSPDPWWIADESLCLIFEDHSNAVSDFIDVKKARQVSSHPNWARANLALSPRASIIPILVSPATKADKAALPHLETVLFWDIAAFREWADRALTVVRELRATFPGNADFAWRSEAMERYKRAAMDPQGLVALLAPLKASVVLALK
jgi:hypothetical protein